MRLLFFQLEEFHPAKIYAVIASFGLQEQDRIFSPNFIVQDCPDRSRLYESKQMFYAILQVVQEVQPDAIVLEDNVYSRALAVKIAKETASACFTDVKEVTRRKDGRYLITPFAFQSNLTYCTDCSGPFVTTMQLTEPCDAKHSSVIQTEEISLSVTDLFGTELSRKGNVNVLKQAKTVFVCGRGVGSKENALHIAKLAESLGASVGASRPVVANGWLPPECLVGISGTMISPQLCLVFGASGSQAFMAGISASKKIISVNQDPSAAIFANSDGGVVCDCMEFAELLNGARYVSESVTK